MNTIPMPVRLRSASFWRLLASMSIGFAVILIPLAVLLTLLSVSGVKVAESAIDSFDGFTSGGPVWRLLLANVELSALYVISLGIVFSASVWIGARIQSRVSHGRDEGLTGSQEGEFGRDQNRPSLRDIIGNLSFIHCLRDLFVGIGWTTALVGVPALTILVLFGQLVGPADEIIADYLALVAGGLLLVTVGTPLLMFGFWIIRGVSKFSARHEPAAV